MIDLNSLKNSWLGSRVAQPAEEVARRKASYLREKRLSISIE